MTNRGWINKINNSAKAKNKVVQFLKILEQINQSKITSKILILIILMI